MLGLAQVDAGVAQAEVPALLDAAAGA